MKRKKTKSPGREELKILVESLGGETPLIRILERFYSRMAEDLMLGYFFEGKPLHEIASKQAGFILLAAGMNQHFAGKGPASAHLAMPPIYEGHFDRRLMLLRAVLEQEGLTSAQIEVWIQFEESFRSIVVSK